MKGSDLYAPLINGADPNTFPSDLVRSISGLSMESKWFENKLESILFGKYYFFKQGIANINTTTGDNVFIFEQQDSDVGYGLALKYSFSKNIFLRGSYENAIRIPSQIEIFGNFITIEPNLSIKPERSDNLNLGLYF